MSVVRSHNVTDEPAARIRILMICLRDGGGCCITDAAVAMMPTSLPLMLKVHKGGCPSPAPVLFPLESEPVPRSILDEEGQPFDGSAHLVKHRLVAPHVHQAPRNEPAGVVLTGPRRAKRPTSEEPASRTTAWTRPSATRGPDAARRRRRRSQSGRDGPRPRTNGPICIAAAPHVKGSTSCCTDSYDRAESNLTSLSRVHTRPTIVFSW
jgi:hypothetical protein